MIKFNAESLKIIKMKVDFNESLNRFKILKKINAESLNMIDFNDDRFKIIKINAESLNMK